jgi:DNA polymerase III subunit delta
MTLEQIIKDIDLRLFRPVYLLMGDEPYYIDRITDYLLQNILQEHEKAFNEYILYGKEVTATDVDNIARRFPMMASHQVVVVREAQNIRKLEDLLYYVQNPLRSTILIINYKFKTIAKNTKLYKAIDANGVVFESNRLYDNQVPEWIANYLRKRRCNISADAALLLTENLGNDLSKIANELNKLLLTLPAGQDKIDARLIEKNIGISKDYNNFELQKALGARDVLKSNRIINYFAGNQKEVPITLTITSLYAYFTKVLSYWFIKEKTPKNVASVLKINPYFVKDYQLAASNYPARKVVEIIGILREYDLKSKGVNAAGTEPGELLREMIYRILH